VIWLIDRHPQINVLVASEDVEGLQGRYGRELLPEHGFTSSARVGGMIVFTRAAAR
jgi:hypothetical protein